MHCRATDALLICYSSLHDDRSGALCNATAHMYMLMLHVTSSVYTTEDIFFYSIKQTRTNELVLVYKKRKYITYLILHLQ